MRVQIPDLVKPSFEGGSDYVHREEVNSLILAWRRDREELERHLSYAQTLVRYLKKKLRREVG